MRIGITGHQKRDGIDWNWVRNEIETKLLSLSEDISGFSSLAEGADQVFAETLIQMGGKLVVVIPTPDYLENFEGSSREKVLTLLAQATATTQLEPQDTDEQSYFAAGKFIADSVDMMIAVWDGKPSEGLGGTADIVEYTRISKKPIYLIDPISQKIGTI